jgi:hypothetical protein
VYFAFSDGKPNLDKFRVLGRGELDEQQRPYFSLDLSKIDFFARSAENQLGILKDFFESSYRDCKALLASP